MLPAACPPSALVVLLAQDLAEKYFDLRDLATFPTPYTRTGRLDSKVTVTNVQMQAPVTEANVCLSCGLLASAPPQGRRPRPCKCGAEAFLLVSSSPSPPPPEPGGGEQNEPNDGECLVDFGDYVTLLPRLLSVPSTPAVSALEWLLDWVSQVQHLSRHDIKGSKRCPDPVRVTPWDDDQLGYASIPVITNSAWAFTYTNRLPDGFSTLQGRIQYERKSGPQAEWVAVSEGPPPTFYVLVALCPQCGRPWAPGASYHALQVPSNLWQLGYEFSPHLARALPLTTRLLAGSATSVFEDIILPGVVNVTAPPWATLCTPPPPTCSLMQSPFVSGLSDTLLPLQEVQPLGFSLLSNNIGGL